MKRTNFNVRRYFFYEYGSAMANIKMYIAMSKRQAVDLYLEDLGFEMSNVLLRAYYIGSMPF